MSKLTWDAAGDRLYETGVDHGVLYVPDTEGDYTDGVAWNGLTTVTEKPTGASSNPQYADNIKYLNLISTEMFDATIQAFTYPDEFAQFDGLAEPVAGVAIGQQGRKFFGLSYRTVLGNDHDGDDHGFKIHLIYGCQASPSQKAYTTVNDKPAAIDFSWDITTTPAIVTDMKPTSTIVIDSTKVDDSALAALELILYGDTAVNPRLPSPDDVVALFSGSVTEVTPTEPAFDSGTDTITIPVISGITYYIDGMAVSGDVVITEDTIVTAQPNAGKVFTSGSDNDWAFTYTP